MQSSLQAWPASKQFTDVTQVNPLKNPSDAATPTSSPLSKPEPDPFDLCLRCLTQCWPNQRSLSLQERLYI